jgi:hypothetical protein
MSFGLLRCGTVHSSQKDHHLSANHLFQGTEKPSAAEEPVRKQHSEI